MAGLCTCIGLCTCLIVSTATAAALCIGCTSVNSQEVKYIPENEK